MEQEQFRQEDIVFGTKWFEKYQSRLLFLLNNKWTKRWFRYCLRIRKCDCKLDTVINKISPNSFSYGGKYINEETIELTTDFRTHDKYSKRLYFAFKPLWYLLHFFDWAMLDRVEQLTKLSFGFSTLTVYPNTAGTIDGYVGRNSVNETYSNLRTGAGNTSNTSATDASITELDATTTSNQYSTLIISIFTLTTSALTADATISAAVFSIFATASPNEKYNGLGSPALHIGGATPVSNSALQNSDYGQRGSTTFGNIAYASYTASQYNDITLNASGIANISLTGISRFCARDAWDMLNDTTGLTWSSGNYMFFGGYYADYTGTTQDPKLVVTYTLPAAGPANLKSYNTNLKANIKSINTNLIANVKSLDTNV